MFLLPHYPDSISSCPASFYLLVVAFRWAPCCEIIKKFGALSHYARKDCSCQLITLGKKKIIVYSLLHGRLYDISYISMRYKSDYMICYDYMISNDSLPMQKKRWSLLLIVLEQCAHSNMLVPNQIFHQFSHNKQSNATNFTAWPRNSFSMCCLCAMKLSWQITECKAA